ncbi:hypothetical protein JG687_00012042 [Phytophthora cactorum]|uniref:Uncharacterized protein n=1 Tax=Phytophthora cactorum TaxID=29920 RepID=A0A8T1U2Y0_9STRA|nr:hypothetical protein JG687_00012042 [Phytophthora cactorum]
MCRLTSQGANKDTQRRSGGQGAANEVPWHLPIFRHGMLLRGDLLRGTEKIFGWAIPGAYQITVRAVARWRSSKEWSHADLKRFK